MEPKKTPLPIRASKEKIFGKNPNKGGIPLIVRKLNERSMIYNWDPEVTLESLLIQFKLILINE